MVYKKHQPHLIKLFAFSLLVLLYVPFSSAFAISQAQINTMGQGVLYFNVDSDQNGNQNCSTSSTNLVGGDNPEKAYLYLNGKSFKSSSGQTMTVSPAAAAAIVGNLMFESAGVNPSLNSGGKVSSSPTSTSTAWGIAQWLGGRQTNLVKYAASNNKPVNDLGLQLDFLWSEASTNSTYLSALTEISAPGITVDSATTTWMNKFEVPGTDPLTNGIAKRIAAANSLAAKYSGGGTASTSSCSSTSGGGIIDGFVEYKQCTYPGSTAPWANKPYSTGTICSSGCGPTAMAMIITNLTGQRVTPDMTAAYGQANGTASPDGGSNWNIASVVGGHWGLRSETIGADAAAIVKTLQSGGLVLATGTGPDPYTSSGHLIVIRGVTSDGKWLTGNSAGYSSKTPYDPSTIISSTRNAWALYKN